MPCRYRRWGSSIRPSSSHETFTPTLEANRAFQILADRGYETIAFSSGYELVALRSANRFVDTGQLNELEVGLAKSTRKILEPLMDALTGDLKSSTIQDRAIAMVPAVRALAAEPSDRPRFHLRPFPAAAPTLRVRIRAARPFAAASHSSSSARMAFRVHSASRMAEEIRLTAGQVGCVEGLAIDMIDGILAGAGTDTAVIVFSDHGPETRLERSNPQPDAIHDRLANLFAARAPGHSDLFPDDITLGCNMLPLLLFGAYLDADLPAQPDTVYFGMPGVGLVPVDSALK